MKPLIGVTPQYDVDTRRIKVEESYFTSIKSAGGIPVLLPLHNQVADLLSLLKHLDGILFSGGPDVHPKFFQEETIPECRNIIIERDELEINLLPMAMELRLPVLGICRGIQVMNIALGGDIYQDIDAQANLHHFVSHYQKAKGTVPVHKVNVEPHTLLSEICNKNEMWVNSFHHQGVRNVAAGLSVAAKSNDGLVEAITKEDYPFFLAIQWHPEEMFTTDEISRKIFSEFIIAASVRNQV